MKRKAAKKTVAKKKTTAKPRKGTVAYREALLATWQASAEQLECLKAEEIRLRLECVGMLADPKVEKGTENVPLKDGFVAKITKKLNYSFVKDKEEGKPEYSTVEQSIKEIEATGQFGALVAERLVKWKPELSLTEYGLLSPQDKDIIDRVLVTSPATPTLEIVPPKETGKNSE